MLTSRSSLRNCCENVSELRSLGNYVILWWYSWLEESFWPVGSLSCEWRIDRLFCCFWSDMTTLIFNTTCFLSLLPSTIKTSSELFILSGSCFSFLSGVSNLLSCFIGGSVLNLLSFKFLLSRAFSFTLSGDSFPFWGLFLVDVSSSTRAASSIFRTSLILFLF